MKKELQSYMAEIGRRGGRKSRRSLSADQARRMVQVREARKAYRRYHAQCFWSYSPDLEVGASDIAWVAELLMRNGDREAWALGARLCK